MQNTREKTEGSNFGLVCFAFDLLNKFKFTVNLSKLGNSSQKHYWSHALSKPSKIPLIKFLNAPPVVSFFLSVAINKTVFFLVCRLLSHLTSAYAETLSCVRCILSYHTYICTLHSQNTLIARYSSILEMSVLYIKTCLGDLDSLDLKGIRLVNIGIGSVLGLCFIFFLLW